MFVEWFRSGLSSVPVIWGGEVTSTLFQWNRSCTRPSSLTTPVETFYVRWCMQVEGLRVPRNRSSLPLHYCGWSVPTTLPVTSITLILWRNRMTFWVKNHLWDLFFRRHGLIHPCSCKQWRTKLFRFMYSYVRDTSRVVVVVIVRMLKTTGQQGRGEWLFRQFLKPK